MYKGINKVRKENGEKSIKPKKITMKQVLKQVKES